MLTMRSLFGLTGIAAATAALILVSCGGGGGTAVNTDTTTYDPSTTGNTQYKQDMRTLVQGISAYARGFKPGFIVIPQNGHELVTLDGSASGSAAAVYLGAISGVGREDLYYGYTTDNTATPQATTDKIIPYLDIAEAAGVQALVTDYCWDQAKVDSSFAKNSVKGYISFAADNRELDRIPAYPAPAAPYSVSTATVATLANAKNFLYLLNSNVQYATKVEFLAALRATNYDAFIIDLFFDDADLGQVAFTSAEIDSLKTKPNGGGRLVIAYMSIGEAEDYRYYWNAAWTATPPSWLIEENPDWPGNYKVEYWDPAWQAVLFGNDTSYLKRILDAGFDGVYLDIIDAFEYFE